MCTGLSIRGSKHYFGRNLDLEYDFGPEVTITPRTYPLTFTQEEGSADHYAMIGMASVMDNYPLYAEAINEKGLGMAGLHFAMYGGYPAPQKDSTYHVAPFEFIPWVLSQCATLAEAEEKLRSLTLTDVPFSPKVPNSKLHWLLADETGAIVVEPMTDGLRVEKDPYHVLTNDPPFSYHATNLNFYLNVTAKNPADRFGGDYTLETMGKGAGGFGLPGDYTSSSRFVRIAFNRANSMCDANEEAEVTQFFHLLDSVAEVRGSVLTEEGTPWYTRYSCCMYDGRFLYKTYENNQITEYDMSRENLDSSELIIYPLIEKQQLRQGN